MADVGYVSVFKVNLYNPLVQRCISILFVHEK
jgi:hypothetical protein